MKASELIKALQAFNPDAEVAVNIQSERYPVEGIWSWEAYPGESSQEERNIPTEKLLTPRISLKTSLSRSMDDM